MTDYPYPANFLEPMPGFPVNMSANIYANVSTSGASDPYAAVGQNLTARDELMLSTLNLSTSVYFNYSGQYPCTNLSDWEGTGDLDGFGWNILACNQLAMPIGYANDSMFLPETFNFTAYTEMC